MTNRPTIFNSNTPGKDLQPAGVSKICLVIESEEKEGY